MTRYIAMRMHGLQDGWGGGKKRWLDLSDAALMRLTATDNGTAVLLPSMRASLFVVARRTEFSHHYRAGNAVCSLCKHLSGNWRHVLSKPRDTTLPKEPV